MEHPLDFDQHDIDVTQKVGYLPRTAYYSVGVSKFEQGAQMVTGSLSRLMYQFLQFKLCIGGGHCVALRLERAIKRLVKFHDTPRSVTTSPLPAVGREQ